MQEAISWDQRCQEQDDETLSNSDSKMSWSWPDNAHTTISSELSSLTFAVRSKKLLKMFFSKKMLKKIRRLRKKQQQQFQFLWDDDERHRTKNLFPGLPLRSKNQQLNSF